MIEFILQIEFTNLGSPDQLTEGLALLILGFLSILAYMSYRLRSAAITFMIMVNMIILIFTFITNLDFLWFWISILLSFIIVGASGIVVYILE